MQICVDGSSDSSKPSQWSDELLDVLGIGAVFVFFMFIGKHTGTNREARHCSFPSCPVNKKGTLEFWVWQSKNPFQFAPTEKLRETDVAVWLKIQELGLRRF